MLVNSSQISIMLQEDKHMDIDACFNCANCYCSSNLCSLRTLNQFRKGWFHKDYPLRFLERIQ